LSEELSIFRKLPFETNNEKFSLRRVKSKKICGNPEEICWRAVRRWAIAKSVSSNAD